MSESLFLEKSIQAPHVEKGEKAELSQEALEQVMAKVQDINEPGIGYTCLRTKAGNTKQLTSIFHDGLLGQDKYADAWENLVTQDPVRRIWAREARQGKDMQIHFNITGRGSEANWRGIDYRTKEPSEIAEGVAVIEETIDERRPIVILFDTSKFKELEPSSNDTPRPSKTFEANDPRVKANWERFKARGGGPSSIADEQGWPKPSSEYGFVLRHRIAPREFTGVMLLTNRFFFESKINRALEKLITAMLEANRQREDLLVPVYDESGNLLWPKKMNYQEIQDMLHQAKNI